MARPRHRDSLIWGIALIIIGAVFLLETFHVEVWRTIWRLWPLIIVAWGASKLYYGLKERREREQAPPAAPPEGQDHEI